MSLFPGGGEGGKPGVYETTSPTHGDQWSFQSLI